MIKIKTMTIKEIIKLEDKANEVWVVSPTLHYDVDDKSFTEIVSVNLGQKTKYRYIVPATKTIKTNIDKYKKAYNITEEEVAKMFCIIQETDFIPFLNELAIYNGNSDSPVSVSTPALDSNEAIKYTADSAKAHAKSFKEIWKKYKRANI
jgi:hypothetical protein